MVLGPVTRARHGSGPLTGRVGLGRIGFGHKILRLWWVGLGRVQCQKSNRPKYAIYTK